VRARVVSTAVVRLGTLLGAGLVAASLVVVPGLPYPFETPKDAILCLTVGAGLALTVSGPAIRIPRTLVAPLLAFLSSGLAASAARDTWNHALVMDGIEILLFVLGLHALVTSDSRARLARLLVAIAATEGILAAVQIVLGPLSLTLLGAAPRRAYAFGTLGVPNWVGALAAMALAPALLAPPARRLDAVATALLVLALVVTGSRGALIAALGVLVFCGVRGAVSRAAPFILAGLLLGALVVVGAGATAQHGPGSLVGRFLIWKATARIIVAHPLLGVAPGGFAGAYPAALHAIMAAPGMESLLRPTAFVTHPHDLLLAVMAERGVAGTLALVWLVTALARLARHREWTDWTRQAAAGTLLAFGLYSVVDVPFASPPLAMAAWLSAAALAAPDEASAAATWHPVVRLILTALAFAAVVFGLAAVDADRRLADAWSAAARGERAIAAGHAERAWVGPARNDAHHVSGLVALGENHLDIALPLLGAAARSAPDPDVYYALATARARAGDVRSGLDVLDWLSVTLPGLAGPHLFAAELRREAGDAGVDEALTETLDAARDSASNPRLDVFVALAAARRRDRHPRQPGVSLVMLDPGHGGEWAGARAGGLVEKDVALQLTKPLVAALHQRGARVVLTRTRDRTVPLDYRARLANLLAPDLFLSIHANAARDSSVHGIELFVRASDGDPDPFPHLSVRDRALLVNALPGGLARAIVARRSLDRCARDAAGDLTRTVASRGDGTPAMLSAGFYLLRQVQAPAVLLEIGYLTNPVDAARLARPSYRRSLAAAIADGAMRAVTTGCRS
jgi:N-acetylmuramoyl-L-alanine amidase